jgi:cellulose synthase/poly-beta-1,6-N-acetylglucosamine synthase-like glycosyltransferase
VAGAPPSVDIVIPTAGRPSLHAVLAALYGGDAPLPGTVLVVFDDAARGPAAARNVGWRTSRAEWIAFLDDDVVPARDWVARLLEDLGTLDADVAGSQGTIRVPLPDDRRPTDWERNVSNLERARWATADMAYRRAALERVGGFDERFGRAYREDADLGLRIAAAGYRIVRGSRVVDHPPRPADRWVSVRLQAGNADDAVMNALHGRRWRERAGAPRGRFNRHLAITAAAALALAATIAGRRRFAALMGAAWAAGTIEFAWARIAPGPRTRDELATMVATSALIPPVAVFYRLAGRMRAPS